MSPITPYILYKNPIQYDTLYIVQYLYSIGINIKPCACVEREYPLEVFELPAIYDLPSKVFHVGLEPVVEYYELKTGISGLLEKSSKFKKENPDYRIH